MILAYQALNLRFNPFGEIDQETRAKLAVIDIDTFRPYFAKKSFILQFLADHGRGKSTHLLALHRTFPDIPYVQLHAGVPASFQTGTRHFVDSIENLSFFKRQRLYRQYDWLAVTTHRDLSWEMRLAGREVKTIHVSQQTTSTLQDILNRRIEYARRDEGDLPFLSIEKVTALQRDYGDDIRAIESALYEEFYLLNEQANNKEKTHGKMSG